jgi:hypothetical protein
LRRVFALRCGALEAGEMIIKLTLTDGRPALLNMVGPFSIVPHPNGLETYISFVSSDGTYTVKETPDQILEMLSAKLCSICSVSFCTRAIEKAVRNETCKWTGDFVQRAPSCCVTALWAQDALPPPHCPWCGKKVEVV